VIVWCAGGGEGGLERSPSTASMARNHSSSALGDLNGDHKVRVISGQHE